jgi:hypothetical protein
MAHPAPHIGRRKETLMELDHSVVPVKDKEAYSKQIAHVMGWTFLGVRGSQGHVRVNDSLVLRFDDKDPNANRKASHYAFHVDAGEFDGILERAKAEGMTYGTSTREANMEWNDLHGGRRTFLHDLEGHSYELMEAASPPALD